MKADDCSQHSPEVNDTSFKNINLEEENGSTEILCGKHSKIQLFTVFMYLESFLCLCL